MQPTVLVSAGTGSSAITGRIGDFSGMNVDPVNGTFWHVNEFGGGGGPTVIANFTPEARPTVTAPSDQVAVEGTSKSINLGSFADPDGSPWNIDIDWGDGTAHSTFSTAVAGSLGTQSHTYAEESAADHPGSNPYVVTVSVTDFTNLIGTANFNISVSDPAVLATGGFTVNAVEGANSGTQTVATFTDPGGAEPLIDYAADINWGDGTPLSAGSISFSAGVFTVQGDHTFASGLGLPDDFGNSFCGATPPSYSKTINIITHHESAPDAIVASTAHIELPPASAHLAGGSLIVIGTVGNDQFILTPVGNTGAVAVALNNVSLGSFTLGIGGRVIVAGLDGNDDIQVAGGVRADTVLYGGPGNDRIKGGGGRNILCGCEGDDQLIAGKLDDLVIGGDGRDNLNSVAGSDILVAGNVIDPITLAEDEKFSHLVNILNGGLFTAGDDGDVDILQGASGNDRFYYHFSGAGPFDIVHGKAENRFNT